MPTLNGESQVRRVIVLLLILGPLIETKVLDSPMEPWVEWEKLHSVCAGTE